MTVIYYTSSVFLESLHSVTRCDHTPTPVHGDRERGMSVNYYYLVIECKDSKKTEEVRN